MATGTVRVYEILADTNREGPAGDGTVIFRFRGEKAANTFAAMHTCYGRPATVRVDDVPKRIAQRWAREGKI